VRLQRHCKGAKQRPGSSGFNKSLTANLNDERVEACRSAKDRIQAISRVAGLMASSLPNPLAVHPLLWAKSFAQADLLNAIDKAARAGFDRIVIPLRDTSTIDIAAVRRRTEAAGITPIATAIMDRTADPSSRDKDVAAAGHERLQRAIAMTRDLGAVHLGGVLYAALGRADQPADQGALGRSAAAFADVAPAAKASRINLAIEPTNRYENNLINTAAQALTFVKATEADNVLIHLDTYHMNIEESDLPAAITACAARLGYLEISESHRGLIGTGRIDVDEIIRTVLAIGYRGSLGFEAFSSEIIEPKASAAFAVWRSNFDDGDFFARHGIARLQQAFAAAQLAGVAAGDD
jgi:D-psicose/D-tagatose/L-ribulose 3-epimerase